MLSIIKNAAFTFSARGRKFASTWGLFPANEINFAERPLAGIHAKLTMLRDNAVIAMRGFACASELLYLRAHSLFPHKPNVFGNLGALWQKRGFATRK